MTATKGASRMLTGTPSQHRPWLRWLVLSAILTGLFTFHVLGNDDQTDLGPRPSSSVEAMVADGPAPAAEVAVAAQLTQQAPTGGHAWMMCDLFVKHGNAVALLLLLLGVVIEVARRASATRSRVSAPRGPPTTARWSRDALCVNLT